MSDDKPAAEKQELPEGMGAEALKEAAEFAKDQKRTPEQWMARLKTYNLGRKLGKQKRAKMPTWQHNVAATLHGWKSHEHHAGEPFRLTEAAYKGALKAVDPPTHKDDGTPIVYQAKDLNKPHKAALSKYAAFDDKGAVKE